MEIQYSDKDLEKAINIFINKEKNCYETRYRSWGKCHNYFFELHRNNKRYEDLTENELELSLLYLGFYLASWGMYRGSSFTLQYDNSIFKEVISIILEEKYRSLWNMDFNIIESDTQGNLVSLLEDLRDSINDKLIVYRNFTKIKSRLFKDKELKSETFYTISQTLVTKILLGTVCCCPAYDTYFIKAIGSSCNNFYDRKKIENLLTYVKSKKHVFQKFMNHYPLMKIVDMAYFQLGIEEDFKKIYNKYIKDCVKPKEDILPQVIKNINQFYYKNSNQEKFNIHVSFNCDIYKVERFIKQYIDN